MAEIVLFHSIRGLRAAGRGVAVNWQADEHTAILPDLYEGKCAENYDDDFRKRTR